MATEDLVSAGGFANINAGGGEGDIDPAVALRQQHLNTNLNAKGFLGGTLGQGARTAPDPREFFNTPSPQHRNLSGAQFSGTQMTPALP